jgi:hypothetical protein
VVHLEAIIDYKDFDVPFNRFCSSGVASAMHSSQVQSDDSQSPNSQGAEIAFETMFTSWKLEEGKVRNCEYIRTNIQLASPLGITHRSGRGSLVFQG